MRLKKHLTIFTVFIMSSKILGFVRDILVAYRLGASVFSDIFFVAFRLPNLFRSAFADGAFSSVFLPIYSEVSVNEGKDKALKFAYKMQSLLIACLIILVIVVTFFMEGMLKLFAPGLLTTDYDRILIFNSRLIFPYIILISIISLFCSILQSAKKFGVISYSSIALNFCLIIPLLLLSNEAPETIVMFLSISVLLSGLFTIIYLFIILKLNSLVPIQTKFSIDEPVRKFLKRIVMAGVSSEIYHINLLIDTFFASTVAYGVSYLYYAERILNLPLSLIGTALSIIILPFMSEAVAKKDIPEAMKIQNKALSFILIWGVPASIALILIPDQIVHGLFVIGGEFDSYSAQQTARALQAYAVGLVAFMLNKIFLTMFFAIGDTKTPAKFACISLIVNTILNFILVEKFQHAGIAFASAFSAWVNFCLIIITLKRRGLYQLSDKIKTILIKVFFSTAVMICVIELSLAFVEVYLNIQISGILNIIVLFLLCSTGLLSYFLVFFIINKIYKYKSNKEVNAK